MKYFLLLFTFCVLFIFGNIAEKVVDENKFSGQWKLIETKSYLTDSDGDLSLTTLNFEDIGIVYHFKEDFTLEISGVKDPMTAPLFNGTYNYELKTDTLDFSDDPAKQHELLILGKAPFLYHFENDELKLELVYPEMLEMIFERIN